MRTLPVLVIAAIFAHVPSGAAAQSLGEVARREEARRKAVTSPGKVYTDGTLRAEPAAPRRPDRAPAAPPPTPASAATAPEPAGAADKPAGPPAAAGQEPKK